MAETWIPPIVSEPEGAGESPAGIGAGGLYSPAVVGAVSQARAGSRYLDPSTGDYSVDSETLNFKQMPPNRQRVLLAVVTKKGSAAAMPSLGIQRPGKITSKFRAELDVFVRSALIHLTDGRRPAISIDDIMAEVVSTGRVQVVISYTDNQTGQQDRAGFFVS